MFKIGDQVAHYKEGVCEIVGIGPLSISCSEKDRDYYTLRPVYNASGVLYIPVDNEKQIRSVMLKDQAIVLVNGMSEIGILCVLEEKKREATYKEALLKNDCESWVQLIKTTYQRKKERIAAGKKVINVDERYLNLAERFLYGELAVVLEISRDEIKNYLLDKMNLNG